MSRRNHHSSGKKKIMGLFYLDVLSRSLLVTGPSMQVISHGFQHHGGPLIFEKITGVEN